MGIQPENQQYKKPQTPPSVPGIIDDNLKKQGASWGGKDKPGIKGKENKPGIDDDENDDTDDVADG